MIAKLNRLLIAILLVAGTIYILLRNWSPTTLTLTSDYQFTAPTGVIAIAIFILGILSTTLVATLFGAAQTLKERKLKSQLGAAGKSLSLILDAKTERTIGNLQKARTLLEQSLRKEPHNALARLELGELLTSMGAKDEAMRVLSSHAVGPTSPPSLLVACASLLERHGNSSAAYDYLSYVKTTLSSADVTATCARLALDLGKIQEGRGYIEELAKSGGSDDLIASLKAKEIQVSDAPIADKLKEAAKVAKSYPKNPHVRKLLADLHLSQGNFEAAATELIQRGKLTQKAIDWREVIRLWLDQDFPRKAIDAGQVGIKQTDNRERQKLRLSLASLQLSTGLETEGAETLEDFARSAATQPGAGSSEDELLNAYFWALSATFHALKSQPGAAQHALLNLERRTPPPTTREGAAADRSVA